MFKIVTNSGDVSYGIADVDCDSLADITDITTDRMSMGSLCFIISTQEVYMLNGQKEWVKI